MEGLVTFLTRCLVPGIGPMNRADYLLANVVACAIGIVTNVVVFGRVFPVFESFDQLPAWYLILGFGPMWVGFCTFLNRARDAGLGVAATVAVFVLPSILTVGMDIGPMLIAILALPLLLLLFWPGGGEAHS